ncbi:rod shape-determining protein MreC, partial [Vibrio cholerae]
PVVEFDRLRYLLLFWPNEDRLHKVMQADPQVQLEEEANAQQ